MPAVCTAAPYAGALQASVRPTEVFAPRFQPRWPRNPRYPEPRRLAAPMFPDMPRLRVWLQFWPFHGFAGRSGDYLCRLPTRVFVPAFFLLDEQRHE